MSADNWAECPQCRKISERESRELAQKVADSYGNVSESEYQSLLKQQITPAEQGHNSLREDYEIGIVEGEFYVIYRGNCADCGFSFEHKYEKDVVVSDRPTNKGKAK